MGKQQSSRPRKRVPKRDALVKFLFRAAYGREMSTSERKRLSAAR